MPIRRTSWLTFSMEVVLADLAVRDLGQGEFFLYGAGPH
jgi:hypothetical protein